MMSGMEGISDTACHTEQIAVICPFPANHFFLFHRAEDGQTCAQSGCWKSGNIAADQGCPAMFRRQCRAFGKSKQLLIAAAVGGKGKECPAGSAPHGGNVAGVAVEKFGTGKFRRGRIVEIMDPGNQVICRCQKQFRASGIHCGAVIPRSQDGIRTAVQQGEQLSQKSPFIHKSLILSQ